MRWLTILGLASCLLVVGCTKQSTQKSDPQGNGQSDRLAQNDPGKDGAAAQLTEEELFERRFPSRQIEPGLAGGMGGGMGGGLGLSLEVENAAADDVSGGFAGGGGFGGDGLSGMGGAAAAPAPPIAENLSAPVETWKRSKIIPNTSRLMIGDEEELPLQGMQVDVRIDGFRARVLLDCYYFNDREEPLEGTFQLRLPNEASPYYLAFGQTRYTTPDLEPHQAEFFSSLELEQSGTSPEEILDLRSDSWREPQSARVVPRQKAAFSYSEIVREQIDPALMEWSGAGIFRTSVYPLEPQKLHRIVIGYDVDLLPVGNDLVYELNLPETLKNFAVDLKVTAPDGTKVTVTPATPTAGKNGRYRFEDPKVHTIKARISKPGTILLKGQAHQVGPLFATRFRPLPPATEGIDGSPQAIFMVDVSLSSNPDHFNVWLKLMEQILEKNRPALKQFAVVFFNVESFWWKERYVTNTSENVAELVAFANTLSLEAATDLGNLFAELAGNQWVRSEGGAAADLFLLSDAAVTWGEYDIYALSALLDQDNLGPLFAYRTGMTGTDTRILQHLTRETGGAVFSVVGEAELAQAARAHRQRPLEIMAVEIPGCHDLLLAGRPSAIFPGQQIQLVGRGEPKQPVEVQLTLKSGLRVTKLIVPIDAVLDSALAARSYGQVAVGQLEDLQVATEPVALAYAKHFRVAQQTCSLLMLESEEDYERFNIKPQEDGALVKSKLASTTVANALDQLTTALGDPKERFLTWLKLFEERSEEGFEISEEFKAALKQMPRESFAVLVKPLECKERMRGGIPKKIQQQLADKELSYDEIIAEAARRHEASGADDALRVLSSFVENSPGDLALARDVAYSAMEWGLREQAYFLFRRVLDARPYEAQTYHLMARCLAEMGQADLALAYYEVALSGNWDGRFGDFPAIVAWDYLRFLRNVVSGEVECSVKEFAVSRLALVAEQFDVNHQCDLVAVISWNTDRTDVDFHVVDPTGEECFYGNPDTKIGGLLSLDVTGGYGPEMFVLKKAKPGVYYMAVAYFADDVSRESTRTKVYVTIYQKWGTPEETVVRKVVTLNADKDFHRIAIIEVGEE